MKKDIFIWGCGGHSKVVSQIVFDENNYELKAYVDGAVTKADEFCGKEVISQKMFLAKFANESLAIAIGENISRQQIFELTKNNFHFPNLIHHSSVVGANVVMGIGNILMPQVVVNPYSTIGDICVLNTRSTLEHDCRLESFATLAPGSTVCGGCHLGSGVYIGAGATVSHGKSIGKWSIVGGGAFVNTDIAELSIYDGVPAKFRATKAIDDKIFV